MSGLLIEAGSDVRMMMMELVSKYHPHLAACDTEIAILFRDKAGKRGGQVVLGKAGKAPKILDVLGKQEYKFILEIASDEWQQLDPTHRVALMDHLLCMCGVEEDEETHDLKFTIKSPDLHYFREEIKRHGDWRPCPIEEESSDVTITLEDSVGA